MKIKRLFNGLVFFCAVIASLLIVLAAFLVCFDVVWKFVSGNFLFWVSDIVEYSLLWITLLGAPWVLREKAHIKMDILINWFSPAKSALLVTATSGIGAVVCFILAWAGAMVTWQYFSTGYRLTTYLETPAWMVIIIVPIGLALLGVQFVAQSASAWQTYKLNHVQAMGD